MRSLTRAAALALAVAALAGCGGDDTTDPTPTQPSHTAAVADATRSAPTTAPASTTVRGTSRAPTSIAPPATSVPEALISIADEHLAFTLALPDEHAIESSGIDDWVGDGSCVAYWWRLAGGVVVEAWPSSCDPENSEPGNGSYGHYRTLADAPSVTPQGSADTVLGPAELGEQVYYECTNSCDRWPLDIAIIELSEPVDPDYPTLTVITTDRDATMDDLRNLLADFGAG